MGMQGEMLLLAENALESFAISTDFTTREILERAVITLFPVVRVSGAAHLLKLYDDKGTHLFMDRSVSEFDYIVRMWMDGDDN